MKKIAFITCLILIVGIQSFAQTTPSSSSMGQTQEPRILSDQTMSSKLQKDITGRNSSLGDAPVTWYDAGYGYYGTYSTNDKDYMVRYDKSGNYVETLTRKEWDDKISASTRDAFDQSEYAGQTVSSYWEVTDPGKKGSYYELSDGSGKRSRVWADETGKFSNQPTGSSKTNKP